MQGTIYFQWFKNGAKINLQNISISNVSSGTNSTFTLSNEANAFFIIKESEKFLEEDKLIREVEKERQELKEYIYSTLHTLKEIEQNKIDKTCILDILYKAEDVSYMEISIEEIRAVQHELEGNVNLFMNKIKSII